MIVAHVFLAPYTLPVPFWMYLYGCAATLVLSFALLAYLATSTSSTHDQHRREVLASGAAWRLWRWTVSGLRVGAAAALAMTIATGVAGPADPALNIGMTLFWVYFLLAFAYLTIVVGDLYDWIGSGPEHVRSLLFDPSREIPVEWATAIASDPWPGARGSISS